jgi:hypothetical protein
MATYKEKAQEVYNMLFSGKLMEAFEKFYHEDVVMTELGETPRVGKNVNREYESKFLSSVKAVHGAGIDSIASDEENKTVHIENWMDIEFADGNRVRMEQVAVQKWDGDFIVAEKFYHK